MPVRHQNGVQLRLYMAHGIVDTRRVWLNARTQRDAPKIDARKIRIDKQCVAVGFELVPVCAEIRHAYSIARGRRTIANDEMSIRRQPTTKGLGDQSKEN